MKKCDNGAEEWGGVGRSYEQKKRGSRAHGRFFYLPHEK